MSDNVEHPSHYNAGSVETIDAIKSALGDAFLDYCRGNVLKYVWRCRHKGNTLEDLRKAAKYLEWAIAETESEKTKRPQPPAIPEGWRELEENEPLSEDDLFDFEGEWVGHECDPSAGVYNSRIHRRHIRKIETENASEVPNSSQWIPKVGDRVRVAKEREVWMYGTIEDIHPRGDLFLFKSDDGRYQGWLLADKLQLIEAAQ